MRLPACGLQFPLKLSPDVAAPAAIAWIGYSQDACVDQHSLFSSLPEIRQDGHGIRSNSRQGFWPAQSRRVSRKLRHKQEMIELAEGLLQ